MQLLGFKGRFGRDRRSRRVRMTFVVDVEVPEHLPWTVVQYRMVDALDLALYVVGTRGERIGTTIENVS